MEDLNFLIYLVELLNQDLDLVLAKRLVFTNQRQGTDPNSSDTAGDNSISSANKFFWQRHDLCKTT